MDCLQTGFNLVWTGFKLVLIGVTGFKLVSIECGLVSIGVDWFLTGFNWGGGMVSNCFHLVWTCFKLVSIKFGQVSNWFQYGVDWFFNCFQLGVDWFQTVFNWCRLI